MEINVALRPLRRLRLSILVVAAARDESKAQIAEILRERDSVAFYSVDCSESPRREYLRIL